ncbi:hypothetical protein [Caviibacterium pharyngocola]|uniref:Uncharacterized protein n=1 Tax=Caviibacterium pharyngocola TaxID=28159 RepID=A0A2M8RVF7_9PAST|nr:hypothetical protein [Caviibacterium pharyngocola]PJG82867.1 hypothetical protein CVP04_05725 [Caviibacterium pharyngocola]
MQLEEDDWDRQNQLRINQDREAIKGKTVSEEQRQWWNNLSDFWKKVFTLLYYEQGFFTMCSPNNYRGICEYGRTTLERENDLLLIFSLNAIQVGEAEYSTYCMLPDPLPDLQQLKIESIPELTYFKNLKQFWINGAMLEDISAVKNISCDYLILSDISCNSIAVLEPLLELKNIRKLGLYINPYLTTVDETILDEFKMKLVENLSNKGISFVDF